MTETENLKPRVGELVRYRAHTYVNVPQTTLVPTYVRPSLKPAADGACVTADYTTDEPDKFQPEGWYIETATERTYIAHADVLALGETETDALAECVLAEYDRIVRLNDALLAVATDEDGLYGAWGEVIDTAAEYTRAPLPWASADQTEEQRVLFDALHAAWQRYRTAIRSELGIV